MWITKASLTCPVKVKRGDKFIPDPLLSSETNLQTDYTSAGFDRGHNMPAADASCDQVANEESFYFSNMTAQYPALNRGDWKTLEMLSRTLALESDSVKVWCGSIGVAKKIGTTSVPTQCWKVVYVKKTKEYMAFIFDNKANLAASKLVYKRSSILTEKPTFEIEAFFESKPSIQMKSLSSYNLKGGYSLLSSQSFK